MRMRHADLDAACDDDLEPVERLFRRARLKGLLRRLHHAGRLADTSIWRDRLGFSRQTAQGIIRQHADLPFANVWTVIEAQSPMLRRGAPLRPSDLIRETTKAERLLRRLTCFQPARTRRSSRYSGSRRCAVDRTCGNR